MKGIIIKNISNDYTIESQGITYTCKARGNFRNKKIIPLVGDVVEFDENNNYITNIMPRKNELIRPSIANIDIAVIVTCVKPSFDSYLLDKTLTIISYNNIIPIIYFTKLDLLNKKEEQEINKYINYYQQIGYIVSTNPVDLIKLIKNKIVVFTGQSGAGKSTLLNKIEPSLKLKTDEISIALGRGKHTTRHTELFNTHDCLIADTPGFSKIDFYNMSKIDIRDNMKEMFDNLEKCKYKDCLHLTEDGCYIQQLLKENKILISRYENYKNFLNGG